jgi:hypothetical protein
VSSFLHTIGSIRDYSWEGLSRIMHDNLWYFNKPPWYKIEASGRQRQVLTLGKWNSSSKCQRANILWWFPFYILYYWNWWYCMVPWWYDHWE